MEWDGEKWKRREAEDHKGEIIHKPFSATKTLTYMAEDGQKEKLGAMDFRETK